MGFLMRGGRRLLRGCRSSSPSFTCLSGPLIILTLKLLRGCIRRSAVELELKFGELCLERVGIGHGLYHVDVLLRDPF